MKRAITQATVLISVAAFGASCAPVGESARSGQLETEGTTAAVSSSESTVEVEDNEGTKSVPYAPESVAALDDRSRELLEAMGADVREADSGVDLVVSGTTEGAAAERPDAAFVDLSPRDGIPLDWEMVRQAQILGRILGREEVAAELDDQFSRARTRAIEARKNSWKFAAMTSNGNQLTPQPAMGDAFWNPVFVMLELTPALAPDGPTDLNAVIDSKPSFLLVTESTKRYGDDGYTPPMRIMVEQQDLAKLAAVEKGNIYVSPVELQDTASVVGYTKVFNELAEQWSATS